MTSDDCATEPIHVPGGVQPHGLLLALAADRTVAQCAANAAAFLGLSPAATLGRPLADLFDLAPALAAAVAAPPAVPRPVGIVRAAGGSFAAAVHRHDGVTVVELTPAADPPADPGAAAAPLAELARLLAAAPPTAEFGRAAAARLRRLGGYDRVAVFAFAPDWSGEVIAEDRAAGVESLLGHHFPASDLPAQARAMYLDNPVRVMVDARAEPAPLVPPAHPETGRPLDLTHAALRAMSPCHREYLGNMGVRASASVAVVRDGRLWGLIVCHHRTPLAPPPGWAAAAVGVAGLVATQVSHDEERDRARGAGFARSLLRLLPVLQAGDVRLGPGLTDLRLGLAELVGAAGLAVVLDGEVHTHGEAPPEADVRRLAGWLDGQPGPVVATDRLAEAAPGVGPVAGAAGVLAAAVPGRPGGWVVWFRPEQVASVTWAGDPRPGDAPPRPRASFAAWAAAVRGRSRPWSAADRAVAAEVVGPDLADVMAVAARAERQRRYEAILFEQVHDAVIVTDPDGVVTFWNDGAARTLGWTAAETVGRHVLDRYPPDAQAEAARILAAVQAGDAFAGVYRDRHKDGRAVWLDLRLHRVRDGAGRVTGIMGASRDVTAEREATTRLRLKQAIVRNARDAILVTEAEPLDPPGPRIVYANPAFLVETGYTLDELLGRTPRLLQGPNTDRAALDRMKEAMRRWQPVRVEVVNYRKDGSEFWAELDMSPLADETGWYTHWIAVQRNVTDRKRAEIEFHRTATLLRAVADNTPDAVFVKDRAGKYLYANPAVADYVGRPVDQVIGRDDAVIFDPLTARHVRDRDLRIMAAGASETVEETLTTAGGAALVLLSTKTPLRDQAGAVVGVVGIARDISALKRAEAELRDREEYLRLLFDASPDCIKVIDPDGRVAAMNAAGLRMIGADDPARVVGACGFDLLAPDHRAAFRAFHDRVCAGERGTLTYDAVGLDGRRGTYESHSVPLDRGGRRTHLSVTRDVTERNRGDEALRASERRYRELFDSHPMPLWVFDRETLRFLAVNAAAAAKYGWTRDEFLGMTIKDIRPPEDVPKLLASLAADDGGYDDAGVWRHRLRDGTDIHVRITSHTLTFGGRPAELVMAQDVTAQFRAEEELRESEERLRLALDAGRLGMFDQDLLTGRIVWSRHHYEMFGYPADDPFPVEYRHFTDRVHPDDLPVVLEKDRAARQGGRVSAHEFRIRLPDGSVRWIAGAGQYYYDTAGRPVRLLGVLTDVSARVEATRRLREAWDTFSAGPAVMARWEIAPPYRALAVTESIRQYGYEPDDLTSGRVAWLDVVHPDDRVRVTAEVAAAQAADARATEHRYRIVTPSGDVRWLFDYTVAVRDDAGRQVFADGYVLDITDLRRTEDALREANDRYRLLADHIGDVVGLRRPDGTYQYVSPSCRRVTGYAHADLIDRDWSGFVHPDDRGAKAEAIRRAAGGPTRAEWRFRRADGRYVWLEAAYTPVPGGGLTVCVFRDVTARKELEDEYRQAQKLEAVGRLAGGVAHDFNNILTAVSVFSELVLAELAPDHPGRESAEQIKAAAARGTALTGQLLAFSRRKLVRPTVVDLNDLVVDLTRMLVRLIPETVRLTVQLAPEALPVLADKGQLEQAVLNLVLNARDAMPGGGQVTVATAEVGPDALPPEAKGAAGGYVRLTVTDTGRGMTSDVRDRAFEPFFTTKPVGQGTGLGLAIVYGAVAEAGGHVAVESAPGRGSAFALYLPRAEGGAAVAVTPPPGPARPAAVVLVADDDPAVRDGTARILTGAGYQVLAVGSGAEAEAACERAGGRVDLLLTDVVMPGTGGLELADRLTGKYPSLKAAFISGYADDGDRRNLQAGRLPFLPKPYTAERLRQFVRQVLAPP